MVVDTLVEGLLDEAVASRLVLHCGYQVGNRYGRNGIDYLRKKIKGFNARAEYGQPILALVDFLDTDVDCPPELLRQWLPNRSDIFLLRAAVRSIESWLLADRNGIARFLGVSISRVPSDPEHLDHPKRALINVARRSRLRDVKYGMLPAPTSSALVGPEYAILLERFALEQWNPDGAASIAPSLARAIERLRALKDRISV